MSNFDIPKVPYLLDLLPKSNLDVKGTSKLLTKSCACTQKNKKKIHIIVNLNTFFALFRF